MNNCTFCVHTVPDTACRLLLHSPILCMYMRTYPTGYLILAGRARNSDDEAAILNVLKAHFKRTVHQAALFGWENNASGEYRWVHQLQCFSVVTDVNMTANSNTLHVTQEKHSSLCSTQVLAITINVWAEALLAIKHWTAGGRAFQPRGLQQLLWSKYHWVETSLPQLYFLAQKVNYECYFQLT